MIGADAEPDVRDAGLIAAAQARRALRDRRHGCVRTYARLLGNEQAGPAASADPRRGGQTTRS